MSSYLPRTMKAAVIVGPRAAELREVPVPAFGADEVLVRLEGSGLCGSNLPVWQGRPWFHYPLEPGAPGHEGWGTVVAAGSQARGVEEGDRVALMSQRAFAEYDVGRCDELVLLPPALAGMDLPGEPLGCAMNIWERSGIRQEHTVAVVGVGFIGALIIQLARRVGARVIAVSRRPWVADLAVRLGAEHAFLLDQRQPEGSDDRLVAGIEALTGGRGVDRAIEAAGLQRTLDVAARVVRVRGRLIIAGYHQDGPRSVDMQQWNWRGVDVINAHERDPRRYVTGMHAALDALETGAIDLGPLISHRVALGHIEDAFALLQDRPSGFLKSDVLVGGLP